MLNTFAKSYLYQEYANDMDLQALVMAFNETAQVYLDALLALNLPIYTMAPVENALLDWVAFALYNIKRPVFGSTVVTGSDNGDYNDDDYNSVAYNDAGVTEAFVFSTATNDQYRRVITWNFFKGDGFQFNARWLKRRVKRFLIGTDGIDPGIDETFDISVTYGANRSIVIAPKATLPNIPLLQQAIAGGFLQLPQPYTYTVTTS